MAWLVIAKSLAQLWQDFDFALIDSPPLLGVLMVNALAASQQLVIPVQTEFLAVKGLERMVATLAMVNRSRKQALPYQIVPTLFDRRTASLGTLKLLRDTYGQHVWQGYIPVDTRLRAPGRDALAVRRQEPWAGRLPGTAQAPVDLQTRSAGGLMTQTRYTGTRPQMAAIVSGWPAAGGHRRRGAVAGTRGARCSR